MKSKKEPSKQVLDITRPRKRTAESAPSAPQIVIPKRSIITVTEPEAVATEPSLKPKQVAKSIQPVTVTSPPEPAEEASGQQAAAKQESQPVDSQPAAAPEQGPQSAPEVPEEQPKPEPKPEAETKQGLQPDPPEEEVATEPPQNTAQETSQQHEPGPSEEDNGTDPKPSKSHPHIHKALEDAKRKQEIQEYIENRDFFVPINAVARKRSLKVSVGLTLVEFILGLVLLNLMLDAGLIHLLEKIPHTNFFNLQ